MHKRIAKRYLKSAGDVFEFQRHKPGIPTIRIDGIEYVLSNDSGPISGTEKSPWKFLWVLNKERGEIAMWRHTDGNNKIYDRLGSWRDRAEELQERGELNVVSEREFKAIDKEMRRREKETSDQMQQDWEDQKGNFQTMLDQKAREFFEKQHKQELETKINAVKSGKSLSLFGFDYREDFPINEEGQKINHIVNNTLKQLNYDWFVGLLKEEGVNVDHDPQAPEWALDDLHREIIDKYEINI